MTTVWLCTGASGRHDAIDPQPYRNLSGRGDPILTLCQGCAQVAAELGVIDRRMASVPVLRDRRQAGPGFRRAFSAWLAHVLERRAA